MQRPSLGETVASTLPPAWRLTAEHQEVVTALANHDFVVERAADDFIIAQGTPNARSAAPKTVQNKLQEIYDLSGHHSLAGFAYHALEATAQSRGRPRLVQLMRRGRLPETDVAWGDGNPAAVRWQDIAGLREFLAQSPQPSEQQLSAVCPPRLTDALTPEPTTFIAEAARPAHAVYRALRAPNLGNRLVPGVSSRWAQIAHLARSTVVSAHEASIIEAIGRYDTGHDAAANLQPPISEKTVHNQANRVAVKLGVKGQGRGRLIAECVRLEVIRP